jgi:hypothetical protein
MLHSGLKCGTSSETDRRDESAVNEVPSEKLIVSTEHVERYVSWEFRGDVTGIFEYKTLAEKDLACISFLSFDNRQLRQLLGSFHGENRLY